MLLLLGIPPKLIHGSFCIQDCLIHSAATVFAMGQKKLCDDVSCSNVDLNSTRTAFTQQPNMSSPPGELEPLWSSCHSLRLVRWMFFSVLISTSSINIFRSNWSKSYSKSMFFFRFPFDFKIFDAFFPPKKHPHQGVSQRHHSSVSSTSSSDSSKHIGKREFCTKAETWQVSIWIADSNVWTSLKTEHCFLLEDWRFITGRFQLYSASAEGATAFTWYLRSSS